MARPIPKKLLTDTVGYSKKTGESSRKPVYAAEVEVKNVLIQRKAVRKQTKTGYEVVGRATMIYDYANSDPTTIIFNNRDKVVDKLDNEVYFVTEYVEQDTLQGKHHREIILK